MRFTVEQAIAAPRLIVEEAFLDPAFYHALGDMPNLAPAEVLDVAEEGEVVRLRVRYRFNGDLPAAARRVLDPAKMTWVDESVVRRGQHVTEFRMVPDHYQDRLRCSGAYRFEERGTATTTQVLQGDLVVRYPIVGPLVERAIVMGMRQHLTHEARLLESWAAAR